MSTSQTSSIVEQPHAETPASMTAVHALEHDILWQQATQEQRVLLQRIAAQRDRLVAARQSRKKAQTVQNAQQTVPADAPLAERLAVFVKLHPMASTAAAGLLLMLGPRKLLRYGGIAWPLISKFRR